MSLRRNWVAATLVWLMLGAGLAGCATSNRPATTMSGTIALIPTTTTAAATRTATGTIPATLLAGLRPIGAGIRFHPPVSGHPTGRCRRRPGVREAHIELFAANRVVLIPAGVGVRPGPRPCYGGVVTLDPTGVVHYRARATLVQLFRAWGQRLSARRLLSFRGRVRFYLDGRRVRRLPRLTEHAEIVLEVGPYVPPHHHFTFPHR